MQFIKKWYTYQKERFPILTYGIYIFAIVIATFAICNSVSTEIEKNILINSPYSYLVEKTTQTIPWIKIIPMYIVTFLQFLMVRIIDEFKDYEEDCKYRPYRPVPRGLIALKELKVLFIICAVLQFGITYLVEPIAIVYLIFVWIFFAIMSKSFFMKKFLSKHILIEVILDELMLPILVIFLSKFITYTDITSSFNQHLKAIDILPFLILTYVISCIVEIARKVRCKEDEEEGVKTYTAVLGIKKTILLLSFLETIVLGLQIVLLGKQYLIFMIGLFVLVGLINFVFVIKKNKLFAKLTELSANIYILITYFSLLMLI